ncbi:hypothetical protein HMPREF0591_0924 [Mycobacterium parascrofulaceum ATCC BAA-614]|uniref:Uncharacterized protein n=1 Tax=Mycobacterium parascrofulaceum ATCC BAA-614 TaxID=525368 RepID=D5P430_9MYCO|nr:MULTISPECIES: hypothetical protein [Mycobacterium]EFG79219.1 hypothetical protein HMPREF0591_0924 [Mycobacterium parascrofulaceum ATCC BAA-614]OCB39644.1 hypothetical protein A9X02_17480 [Mycobacterium malmoense]
MADKWFSDSSAPGQLTLADLCDQIEQKMHLNADNQKSPQEFSDWQSCVADRDATIYKLSAAIVNLCQMVKYLSAEGQRGDT